MSYYSRSDSGSDRSWSDDDDYRRSSFRSPSASSHRSHRTSKSLRSIAASRASHRSSRQRDRDQLDLFPGAPGVMSQVGALVGPLALGVHGVLDPHKSIGVRDNTDIDFGYLYDAALHPTSAFPDDIRNLLLDNDFRLGPHDVHAVLVVKWEQEIGDVDILLTRPDGTVLSPHGNEESPECFLAKDGRGLGIGLVVFDNGYQSGLYRVVVRQRSFGESAPVTRTRAALYDFAAEDRYLKASVAWLADAEGEGETWMVGSFEFSGLDRLRWLSRYNKIVVSSDKIKFRDDGDNTREHHLVPRVSLPPMSAAAAAPQSFSPHRPGFVFPTTIPPSPGSVSVAATTECPYCHRLIPFQPGMAGCSFCLRPF
eukprot:gnl/Hemi2/16723_TR5606_c0_g1_i1.p2 gnl/Hemi2/16723_TR5606_c0_g1~~gnl/Hemi2/16723_TR5606_c0_g1_i1.p2  ORF type:complete len:368 (-),score=112.11 gnl/Hemi2/16723_TR5606_c0_g1_i1:123-1226(-)